VDAATTELLGMRTALVGIQVRANTNTSTQVGVLVFIFAHERLGGQGFGCGYRYGGYGCHTRSGFPVPVPFPNTEFEPWMSTKQVKKLSGAANADIPKSFSSNRSTQNVFSGLIRVKWVVSVEPRVLSVRFKHLNFPLA
jgi:hypothetical protein